MECVGKVTAADRFVADRLRFDRDDVVHQGDRSRSDVGTFLMKDAGTGPSVFGESVDIVVELTGTDVRDESAGPQSFERCLDDGERQADLGCDPASGAVATGEQDLRDECFEERLAESEFVGGPGLAGPVFLAGEESCQQCRIANPRVDSGRRGHEIVFLP